MDDPADWVPVGEASGPLDPSGPLDVGPGIDVDDVALQLTTATPMMIAVRTRTESASLAGPR